jgi:cag pathogenicity island protein 24
MKFRVLNNEELEPLKKEFVIFLSANGIDAKLWEEMKVKNTNQANELIQSFSESVWYKIFSNKKHLELSDNEAIYHFDFQQDKLIILKIGKEVNQIGKKEQNYLQSREEDMFQWMQQGALFTDGAAYREALMLWYDNRSN